jgi:hypothetical protein
MVREQTALVRDRLTEFVSTVRADGELAPVLEPRVLATLLLERVSGTQLTYLQVGELGTGHPFGTTASQGVMP